MDDKNAAIQCLYDALDSSKNKVWSDSIMDAINKLHVKAPTAIGQVVLPDVCGLGANVIITKNVAAL